MNASLLLARQAHLLLQLGLTLILYSSIDGFAIPHLAVLLLTQGLLWPRLKFGAAASRVAFWCSLYGTLAILAAYTIAAIWGVGNETIWLMGELPHGLTRGTVFQETFIKALAYFVCADGSNRLYADAMGPTGRRVKHNVDTVPADPAQRFAQGRAA
jgi:hydroxylaminobenzene mutase